MCCAFLVALEIRRGCCFCVGGGWLVLVAVLWWWRQSDFVRSSATIGVGGSAVVMAMAMATEWFQAVRLNKAWMLFLCWWWW